MNTRILPLKIAIDEPSKLGLLVRITRKTLGLRQDDAAGSMGVSENFLGKIERGDCSVQWGKLFSVLRDLGVHVWVDVPENVAARLPPELSRRSP